MFTQEENDVLVELTVKQCQLFATDCLHQYFHTKKLHSGGPIPNSIFTNPQIVSRTLNTSPSQGFVLAHKLLGEPTLEEKREVERSRGIYRSTRIIIEVLEECAKMHIPRRIATGILLLHLELCEGCSLY